MEIWRNYIGGAWIEASPAAAELDVVRAVQAANKSLRQALSPGDLRTYLTALAEQLKLRGDEVITAEAAESGRPIRALREIDLPRAIGLIERIRATLKDYGDLSSGRQSPAGVVALVLSAERPLVSVVARMASALVAGNAIVVKPSTKGRASVRILAEILNEIGLPPGRFNVVGGDALVGAALTRHPGVRRVDFAGRIEVARDILLATADSSKRVRIESSSKNVVIVMRDADITSLAAPLARASLWGYHKILAQDEIMVSLGEALAKEFGKLNIGEATAETTDLGPLQTDAEVLELRRWFDLALSEDGRPLTGSSFNEESRLVRPMLISELTNCSELHQTQVRGPLVTLNSFKYVTDAIKWANNSPFGQRASVWTKSLPWLKKLSAELVFGTVLFNAFEPPPTFPPEFGLKSSGTGDVHDFYSDNKQIYF